MEIEAYILVGGRSRRFGQDKATFKFEGETLADRSARIARTASDLPEVTFVAAAVGQFSQFDEAKVIADIYQNRGPFGAVHSALSIARAPWILVLAVDLPFVSVEFISNLKSEISDHHDAIVPLQENGLPQPLCAFYRVAACRDVFEKAVKKEGKVPSIREVIGALNTRYVGFEEYSHLPYSNRLLRNVNSPRDLADI